MFSTNGKRTSPAALCLCALLATCLAGCSVLPTLPLLEKQAASASPAPQRPADGTPQAIDRLERIIAGTQLSPHNKVELLKDGPQTHSQQLAAIAHARHSIDLAMYIFMDDKLGREYVQALTRKARAGVTVRVMVDGLGGHEAADAFGKPLSESGVEFRTFNTVKDWRFWRLVHRNHQKLLVVDGIEAYTGGINITDDYLSSPSGGNSGASSSGSSAPDDGQPKRGWRDTQIRVRGPAVAQFERVFLDYWQRLGPPTPGQDYPPRTWPADHGDLVRVIADDGEDLLDALSMPLRPIGDASGERRTHNARIYASYLNAIHHARKRIWIAQAYFAPSADIVNELIAAAARGVDVRLLAPGSGDVKIMVRAAQSRYARLLEGGVRIYEYKESTVMHAKTAVIDGIWSTVGSANLDYRSFLFNDEANATIVGRDFAASMEKTFESDLASAHEITLAEWRGRPLSARWREWLARLATPFI